MLGRLPDRIEPLVLAEAGRRFEGEIPLLAMERIAAQALSTAGQFHVAAEFGTDESGIRYLAGRITGTVQLQCQRCLGPIDIPIDTRFRLGLVVDEEEAQRLPPHYEVLMVASEPMRAAAVFEDEVILALPIAALHDESHPCGQSRHQEVKPEDVQRENPFAVLAQLKRDS